MSLFRSSNAGAEDLPTSTRRWQGFRVVVMAVFVVFGFYAQRYNTEPSGLLSLFAIILSAAVVFAVTLPLFLIQCRGPGIGEGQRLLVLLIVLPVTGYLSWNASTSFPIIWTTEEPQTVHSQAQLRFIVTMGSAGCNHTAHLQSPQGNRKLCLEPHLAQRLKEGDQVELLVSESRFGKRYSLKIP